MNFLEDHGFLIESDKTETVIDPHASFTMEYLDMIMTIKSNAWKVLLVPTARLEFRITEFSWRDIPYFMCSWRGLDVDRRARISQLYTPNPHTRDAFFCPLPHTGHVMTIVHVLIGC